MRNWTFLVLVLFLPALAHASPSFTDIDAGLTGADVGTAVWGDYDNDGDLDILLTGYTGEEFISRIYRNDSGIFTDINAGLTGVWYSSAAWGDYDGDGDLDILLTGSVNNSSTYISRIYRNDSGAFVDIEAGLPGVRYGSVAWGDYDNDGDLDIALTGSSSTGDIALIYRNDSGRFVEASSGLPGVRYSSVAWGDYDNDGDLDILLAGSHGSQALTRVYRNDSGNFTDIESPLLTGVWYGSAVWGDYDHDGYLDILLSGYTDSGFVTRIYRSYPGTDIFVDIDAGLPDLVESSAAWGDYDNDGDLDVLLTGSTGSAHLSRIYRNDGGVFQDAGASLPGVLLGDASWGDYDNDGDLDVLLMGSTGSGFLAGIFRNEGTVTNTPPPAPTNPRTTIDGNLVTFSWNAASDAETPQGGLSYNLSIGTVRGGNEIAPAMAEAATGYRRVIRLGNAQTRTSWTVRMPPGHFYWSVQTIDGAYAGSPFVQGVSFDVSGFSAVGAGLPGISPGTVAWGDYDNDGDLDVLLSGDTGSEYINRIYRHDASGFSEVGAGLVGTKQGSAVWGDYDNDGDLDLAVTGSSSTAFIARIYRNDSGRFVDIQAGLVGASRGAAAWGDYDNDGDLDLLLTGNSGPSYVALLYRNDSGTFTNIGAGLPGVVNGSVAWGDYDSDGDLDILLRGDTILGPITRVYRNDDGIFSDAMLGLPATQSGSANWGDYDADGDLDLLLIGISAAGPLTAVFRNDSGSFSDVNFALPVFKYNGFACWGDYDNDGALDILLTGDDGHGPVSSVYRNEGNAFVEIKANLLGVSSGKAAWGDYDNDGDLDVLLAGSSLLEGKVSRIYRNESLRTNTVPSAPTNLSTHMSGSGTTFSWDPGNDTQTPTAGLSYNLRIGTTPGGSEISSAMADGLTGYRRIAQLGNVQARTEWDIELVPGKYYWSVQAIDAGYAGSAFADEESFHVVKLSDIGAGLPGIQSSSAVWGDYDDDGDLDILLMGETDSGRVSRIYANNSAVFTNIDVGLPGVSSGQAAWGDYDNDGDLDLVLSGETNSGFISRIYRNDEGVFTDIGAGLPGVAYSSVAWGDFDNDGDLDLALTGTAGGENLAHVYRNDGGSFSDSGASLVGVSSGSATWADYDEDGDLDLLLTGSTDQGAIASIYRNDSGVLTVVASGLPGREYGSAAWGDFDNDGDLDLLLTGSSGSDNFASVYRNDSGSFTDIGVELVGVRSSSCAWGDYDNDGDLDILLSGEGGSGPTTKIFLNDSASFTDSRAQLPAVSNGSATWADYDNDGDLDIFLCGSTGTESIARIYRSRGWFANTAPGIPFHLSSQRSGPRVTFSWDAPTDAETPPTGLSYNLRIGTSLGGEEISSSMAQSTTGWRKVVQLGNTQERTSWVVELAPGTYYWSVQAVDGAFAASPFTKERRIQVIRFSDIEAGLVGISLGTAAWGDYDGDGDLDILLIGSLDPLNFFGDYTGRIYRNDSGTFTDIGAELIGTEGGSAVWGDYDNDGDLDLLLTGIRGCCENEQLFTRLYRNDSGMFTESAVSLPGVANSSLDWGDYDNDGDLDLLLSGSTGSGPITYLYRNDSGTFTYIDSGLPAVHFGKVDWGDYDNDGDLDILLCGSSPLGAIARIYRNDSGNFTDIEAGLPGVSNGSTSWGDYDGDGDLDILMTGRAISTTTETATAIYRNDNGRFVDTESYLPGAMGGAAAWGDYDNDGDLDILLSGVTNSGWFTSIYRNDSGFFTNAGAWLPYAANSTAAWGDYDNDGDLDILMSGESGSPITRILRSDGAVANLPPEAPSGLSLYRQGDMLVFSWTEASDAETPGVDLTYNLRVGTTPGGSEISTAMADPLTGYRRVVQRGNVQFRTSHALRLPLGQYYWSVQAIDGAFAGSPFAPEQSVMAVTGVTDLLQPKTFALRENVPNPFNPATTIRYELPAACKVSLRIYDTRGRLVTTLDEGWRSSGVHEVMWRGADKRGRQVGSGVYFYRLDAGSFHESRRMVKVQ